MINVQSTEAKARFAELLRTVERGETVAITRHGQTVAHVVPAMDSQRARYEAFEEKLRRFHEKWGPAGMSIEEIVDLKHAGHDRQGLCA